MAYLYNGVPLPKLPPKISEFFYALVCFDNRTDEYSLILGIEAFLYENRQDGYAEINYYGQHWFSYKAQKGAKAWEFRHEGTIGVTGFILRPDRYDYIWTSHDIPDMFGTVHFSGSTPMPIYDKGVEKLWI